jgi:hypothetical protein
MSKKTGFKYGILIGVGLLTAYISAFLAIGVFFIWQTELPGDVWGWVTLVFSSLAYILIGIILFIPILVTSLFFVFRDQNIGLIGLPLLATAVYALLPIPLPGPLDEAIIFVLGYWLRVRAKHQFREKSQSIRTEIEEEDYQAAEYERHRQRTRKNDDQVIEIEAERVE